MSLIKWVLLLLMLTASAHARERLQPFAPYNFNRSAEEGLAVVKKNPQKWAAFLTETSQLAGQPQSEVERQWNDGEYHEVDCHTKKCAMITAGFYPGGGVGYVRRYSKSGERVSCLTSAPQACVSWRCVNPTYIPPELLLPPLTPMVEEELWERVYVCWQGPTTYTNENSTMILPSGVPFAGVTGASSSALAAATAGSSTQIQVNGSSTSIISNTVASATSSALISGNTIVGGWGLSSSPIVINNAITIGRPNAGCGYVLQPTRE